MNGENYGIPAFLKHIPLLSFWVIYGINCHKNPFFRT
jgi:hypothetical protein